MKKKVVIFTMILILSLSSMSYASKQAEANSAQVLVSLGLLKGYDNGDLGLGNQMTRSEFAAMAVRIIGKDGDVRSSRGPTIFKDVRDNHWATGYINVAQRNGLIAGYGNGNFGPEDPITNVEVLTILVRILGYQNSLDPSKSWPVNYVTKATELGIANEEILPSNSIAMRGRVFHYIDKSLLVNLKIQY